MIIKISYNTDLRYPDTSVEAIPNNKWKSYLRSISAKNKDSQQEFGYEMDPKDYKMAVKKAPSKDDLANVEKLLYSSAGAKLPRDVAALLCGCATEEAKDAAVMALAAKWLPTDLVGMTIDPVRKEPIYEYD